MRWGRAVVCAVAGCLAFGLSAAVGTEARIPIVGWAGVSMGSDPMDTKFTFTPRDLEWKMWPRALATAEILWTNPDPAKRDFAEFSARAAEHRRRLVREHVHCAPLKGKAAGCDDHD